MYRIALLCYCLLFVAHLSAQDIEQETLRPHEFILAFGTASSAEGSVFNLPADDVHASPDFSFYLGYYYSLSERLAVGGHFFGYSQTINDVGIIDASSTFKIVSFNLAPMHLGLQVRYMLMTGSVEPFVSAMANIVVGSLENKEYGTLTMFGYGAGGTAGVRVYIFDSVTFSIHGYGAFGSASFKKNPFLNSVGKDFNPSMAGVIFGLAYHWGD